MTKTHRDTQEGWEESFEKCTGHICNHETSDDHYVVYKEDLERLFYALIARTRKEERAKGYKDALNDMFREIYLLCCDDSGFSTGNVTTHMDEIHQIREKLVTRLIQE